MTYADDATLKNATTYCKQTNVTALRVLEIRKLVAVSYATIVYVRSINWSNQSIDMTSSRQ